MEEKIYKIYKMTNVITNKIYIGITRRDLQKRINNHIRNSKKPRYKLQRAIFKYGIDSFSIEVVCEKLSRAEAMSKEIELIAFYNSYKGGYNSTIGGECPTQSRGHIYWTEDSKRRYSESRKKWLETEDGLKFRQQARERFLILKPEQYITPETRIEAAKKYKEWLYNTDAGHARRKWSAENMRKVQKLQHNGTYKLQDPTGVIHIINGDIMLFCKQHNLSFHSFYYALTHNTHNVRGPNAGWKIKEWNVKNAKHSAL